MAEEVITDSKRMKRRTFSPQRKLSSVPGSSSESQSRMMIRGAGKTGSGNLPPPRQTGGAAQYTPGAKASCFNAYNLRDPVEKTPDRDRDRIYGGQNADGQKLSRGL